MKALILSGGTGTRLRPLTWSQAKQLIPVANKPILFYIIEKVAKAGIKEVGIITGDTGKAVRAAAGTGGRWGVNITYIDQPLPLGLAHAVVTASDFLGADSFLMILGDNLFQMELSGFIEKFECSGANASVMLHKVAGTAGFGVAVIRDGQIEKLVEKPPTPISDLIITGIYLFDNTIFDAIRRIIPSVRGELEITDAIQKLLETGGRVTYDIIKGWWKDTGQLTDMLEANRLLLDGRSGIDSVMQERLGPGDILHTGSSEIIGPAVIGSCCRITDSRLGPYVSVGDNVSICGCDIENSILLDGSVLENIPRKISSSLIGRNCTIKGTKDSPRTIGFFTGDNDMISI